jgi:hypothetical protein
MEKRDMVRVLAVFLVLLPTFAATARADDTGDEKARADEFLAFAVRESKLYEFRSRGGELGPITRRPEPILRWSNPVAGTIYGDVFLWTANGQPVVIGSFHKWYSPHKHRADEFLSLTSIPLRGERDGSVVWTPGPSTLAMKPIPDAPIPAENAPQRLRQMRDLAKAFSAREIDRRDVDRELRLLAQPVYRYEGTTGNLVDGALYVFVQGTDPEAFLLIECRTVDGKPRWEYGLARMNSIALRVSHKGREVWSAPLLPWAQVANPSAPYVTYTFNPDPEKP